MNSFSQIQTLFLQWHNHHGICSTDQIRTACSNLMKSFGIEVKHSLYRVFMPLVRQGLIEFCGNGKYKVSQPTILFYHNEHIAVGVNLLVEHKNALSQIGKIDEGEFGIVRLKAAKKLIQNFCVKNNCDYSEPDIPEILSNFPKISDVVTKFEPALISSSGEYFDVLMHRWKKNKNQGLGVFRLSEDSFKLYLRTKQRDIQIPDFRTNPEGRHLAECFQASFENHPFLFYKKADKTLTVKHINIPILIERVLRMASMASQNGVKEISGKDIYENITLSTIKQLNRIFGTKAIINP